MPLARDGLKQSEPKASFAKMRGWAMTPPSARAGGVGLRTANAPRFRSEADLLALAPLLTATKPPLAFAFVCEMH